MRSTGCGSSMNPCSFKTGGIGILCILSKQFVCPFRVIWESKCPSPSTQLRPLATFLIHSFIQVQLELEVRVRRNSLHLRVSCFRSHRDFHSRKGEGEKDGEMDVNQATSKRGQMESRAVSFTLSPRHRNVSRYVVHLLNKYRKRGLDDYLLPRILFVAELQQDPKDLDLIRVEIKHPLIRLSVTQFLRSP